MKFLPASCLCFTFQNFVWILLLKFSFINVKKIYDYWPTFTILVDMEMIWNSTLKDENAISFIYHLLDEINGSVVVHFLISIVLGHLIFHKSFVLSLIAAYPGTPFCYLVQNVFLSVKTIWAYQYMCAFQNLVFLSLSPVK